MLLQGEPYMIALMGGAAIVLLALAIMAAIIASLKTFQARQFEGLLSRTEQKADALETRLSDLLNAVPVALVETDMAGKFTFANAAAHSLLGANDADLIGLPSQSASWGLTYPDGREIPADLLPVARALKGQTVKGFQHRLTQQESQKHILVSATAMPIINEQGEVTGSTTAMVELEIQTGEGVDDLSGLWRGRWFSAATVPYWGVDETGRIIDINPAALTVFGLTREQAVGQNWTQFFVDDGDFQKAIDYLAEHGANPMTLQLKTRLFQVWAWAAQSHTGKMHGLTLMGLPATPVTEAPAEAVFSPYPFATPEATPKTETEPQALRDYQLAETARAALGVGTWRYDPVSDKIIEDAAMMALIGREGPDAPTLISDADQVTADAAFAELLTGKTDHLALAIQITHKDGTVHHLAIEGQAVPSDDGLRHIYGVAFDRSAWPSAPVPPPAALRPDDTPRLKALQAQIDKLSQALIEARRYETVGRLTTDVVQDFNHTLNVINGALEVMGQQPDNPETVKRLADAALNAGKRGERLTRQLQAFQSQDD
ncbi:MAG: PAS domain-containing protein [Asticcacaulis sp.]